MYIKRLLWTLLIFTSSLISSAQNSIRINEIMISNVDGYLVDYDFPDSWVEIYNSTSNSLNLKGYSLQNTTADGTETYTFPSDIEIPANGYFVVCCDKLAKTFHTSFKLDAEGGTLILLNSNGQTLDEITFPSMVAPGVGYGRTYEDDNTWQWEKTASPAMQNTGVFTSVVLPAPVFSVQGHMMGDAEDVSITLPEGNFPEDTKIYITTNGQEPTIKSESATSFAVNISKSTVIRAKLMSETAISRPSTTQSYIFHPRETNIPVISIVTDSLYLFDDSLGICSSDTVADNKPNYSQDWRRPINMEYLGCKGETALFNQIGETGLNGASSRQAPQKSFKLISNKRFGTKHIKGKLWDDKPNIDENKSFLLRNGGSCTGTYRITDGFIQKLFGRHVKNLDWQAYTPAISYINGEYYGICGLRERSDEDYVWANYDGEEDIERVESLTDKTNTDYKEFLSIVQKEGSTYKDIEPYIDVQEWCNYLCLQVFAANTDWPYNNVSLWRIVNNGKWRWITKDIDYLGIALIPDLTTDILNFNMLKYLTVTGDEDSQEYKVAYKKNWNFSSFSIFKKILPMEEFRDALVDRFSVYLGDFLKPSCTQSLYQAMTNEIQPELVQTWLIYGQRKTESEANWVINKYYWQKISSFLANRSHNVYQHLADFYNLGTVVPMTIKPNEADVKINDISLTEGDFDGCYFSDRELRLNSGAKNIGWKMTTYTIGTDTTSSEYTFSNQNVCLTLKDYVGCDSVSFETYSMGDNEFEMKLTELAIVKSECTDLSEDTEISLAEPQYAYANITVDALPTGKTDNLHAYIDFYDNSGNYFHKPILLNLQGSDEPKVSLSVQFADGDWTDEDAPSFTFGNWVDQDEFHLKALQEDALRGTAEVAYKLYDQMLGVSEGARMTADAFPMSLYVNGNYYGMMAWQLKKHRKNMNLTKDDATNVWIDGKINDKQVFGGTLNWTKFEIRNPKDLFNMDGTDYDGDNPQEIIDATSTAYTGKKKMVRCAEAKQHIIELSKYCNELTDLETEGATAEDMCAAISERFDTESLINYIVFSLVTNNYDGFSDNWQWFTRDGKKWAVTPYNCELTFGLNDDSNNLWQATQGSKKYDYKMENALTTGPMPWIKKYFWDDVKARYAELRDAEILQADNIVGIAQAWSARIDKTNYDEEYAKWSVGTNNISSADEMVNHIKSWTIQRLALEDKYLEYTPLADVNKDGTIDICDLTWLINYMQDMQKYDSQYDINRDGKISIDDVNSLKNELFRQ